MGFFNGTTHIVRFQVKQKEEVTITGEMIRQALERFSFANAIETSDYHKTGFTLAFDSDMSEFLQPHWYCCHPWVFFGLRIDTRKVPSAILSSELRKAETEFLAQNPNFSHVPKGKRQELREVIHAKLIESVLPVPTFSSVIWNIETGELFFDKTTASLQEALLQIMDTAFDVHLSQPAPFTRVQDLFNGEDLTNRVARLNQQGGHSVLETIANTEELFSEFFLWLFHHCYNGSAAFIADHLGPFTVVLDEHFTLEGGEGGQKVVVTGSQDFVTEIKAAMNRGKRLTKVWMKIQFEEESFSFRIDSKWLKIAGAKMEMFVDLHDDDDQDAMRAAQMLDRAGMIDKLIDYLDALQYQFFALRSSQGWLEEAAKISNWLKE